MLPPVLALAWEGRSPPHPTPSYRYLPALSCIELLADEAFLTIMARPTDWENLALKSTLAGLRIMLDPGVTAVTPFAAESYFMICEALCVLYHLRAYIDQNPEQSYAGAEALKAMERDVLVQHMKNARERCVAVSKLYVANKRKADGLVLLVDMELEVKPTRNAVCIRKMKPLKVGAKKASFKMEEDWFSDYIAWLEGGGQTQ